MYADSGTVLVAGGSEKRVARIADLLADSLSVRSFVTTDDGDWPTTDVVVVVYVDGIVADHAALETLPEDTAHVAVFESADAFDSVRPATFDCVVIDPAVPDDLPSTVVSLARRVRYDRRLRECAKLAAECGQVESNGNGRSTSEPKQVCEEIADAKAELDGLVAQFTSEDFRQAFQTLAAD